MCSDQNCIVWNLLVFFNTSLKSLLINHLIHIFQVLLFFRLVSLILSGLIFLEYLRTKWEGMLNLKILIIFQRVLVPFAVFLGAVCWWWKLLKFLFVVEKSFLEHVAPLVVFLCTSGMALNHPKSPRTPCRHWSLTDVSFLVGGSALYSGC